MVTGSYKNYVTQNFKLLSYCNPLTRIIGTPPFLRGEEMNSNYLPRRGGDKRSESIVHGQVFFKRKGGAGVGIEEGSGEEWKWKQRGEWKQKSLKGRGGEGASWVKE